jgi:hypothetical protein
MTYFRQSPPVSVFMAHGFAEREYFRHSAALIRKQYPDTFLLLEGRGVPRQELLEGEFFQINLYSDEVFGLPDGLFTDRRVNWHNQQLGQKGLIAAAGLYVHGDSLTITVMQSDLCQQLYRHPEFKRVCKTQTEKRFGYWYRVLFNAVLSFAMERGLPSVCCPTASSICGFTARRIRPEMFERIYDSPTRHYNCRKIQVGSAEYWEVSLAENANRIVRLCETALPPPSQPKTAICIFHDTEENVDTQVSPRECRNSLTRMLEIESQMGVETSYNLLGTLFRDKQDQIRSSNPMHSLAFHSFNHDLDDDTQLTRCREVDLQVRGYRPPRSQLTAELTDYQLSYLNFEWLACGRGGLQAASYFVQNGIVKIPIFTDDYPLFTGGLGYEEWEGRILHSARESSFFAFGLHDCYAACWLEGYPRLLEELARIGTFVPADRICDGAFWMDGVEQPVVSASGRQS